MQRELELQRETLHQNEKMSALGGLLAGVAHELNNPLSVVLGLSLMMKESAADAKTAERADKISKAAERCARIVKTFLAMAQAATGADLERHDRRDHRRRRRGGRLFHPLVRRRAVDRPRAAPAGDLGRSRPAQPGLINLLVNAEQALHGWDGQRKIAVSAAGCSAGRGNIVVRVADTGPGIPKDILPRIFEPFFTTKEVGAGTGIGLSFCHRIVQSHGGTIHVETDARAADRRSSSTLPASGSADTSGESRRGGAAAIRQASPAWSSTTKRRSAN